MKKSVLLLSTIIFSAIGFSAAAQQYHTKPFVDLLDAKVKDLKGSKPSDTVMTAKKMAEMFDFSNHHQKFPNLWSTFPLIFLEIRSSGGPSSVSQDE